MPAAIDGTGVALSPACDGTAAPASPPPAVVTDIVLATSLASDAAVGDLFGEPVGVAAASVPSFAAEPAGVFLISATTEAIFASDPAADFVFVEPPASPPSPASATFDAFLLITSFSAEEDFGGSSLSAAALSSLTADVAALSSFTADSSDLVSFRCMPPGAGLGDIVPAATDGDGIAGC